MLAVLRKGLSITFAPCPHFLSSCTTVTGWTSPPEHQPSLQHRFPWGESLGSKLDQTLHTQLWLIVIYTLNCFTLSSTAHLSSRTPIQELVSSLLCDNCTTDILLHWVPSHCKYNSHWYLDSVCLQLQEKYAIPSSAPPPARDLHPLLTKGVLRLEPFFPSQPFVSLCWASQHTLWSLQTHGRRLVAQTVNTRAMPAYDQLINSIIIKSKDTFK